MTKGRDKNLIELRDEAQRRLRQRLMRHTPGEDEIPTCVADHLRRSEQRGQGLLLISRTDYVPSSWWDQAQARIAPRALQSIHLPFHMVRAGTPQAHYEYIWSPRGTQP